MLRFHDPVRRSARDIAYVSAFAAFTENTQALGSSDTPEIRRGAGAVTVRFVVNPSSLPAGISAPTRFIWVLIGSTRQFPQPFVLQSYQPAILNWVGGTGNPASVTFNFDAGVSATDRDLIQRGIELGRSFFNSAFQHGFLAATIVNATVNPSPSGVSANASGHRNGETRRRCKNRRFLFTSSFTCFKKKRDGHRTGILPEQFGCSREQPSTWGTLL